MKQYYLHDGQNQIGPFSTEELKERNITRETFVWKEGMTDWVKAEEMAELNGLFASIPPPFKKNSDIQAPPILQSDSTSYQSTYNEDIEPPKKKIKTLLILGVVIVVCGIIGWLMYQNNTQQAKIDEVQQKITQQQDEQEQIKIEEQNKQAEKDRINAANTEKYMGYRNNWKSFINVGSNEYTYSAAGGISNLEVRVQNLTDKIIDEVQVRVDYIKANGGVFKSEMVSVINIGPNSIKSASAPNSERGTSVNMEIVNIGASSFHFCYPSGMEGNKNSDPYFCK